MVGFFARRKRLKSTSSVSALALALPLGIGGAVIMPGEAQAQAQEIIRNEVDCSSAGFPLVPPPGAQCFTESRASDAGWQQTVQEAAICPVGDLSCGATALAIREDVRVNTFHVMEVGGTEVYRENPSQLAITGQFYVDTISRTETVTTSTILSRQEQFETRITGRIEGGTPLFDETLPVPVDDPLAIAALGNAALAVTTAGGPGVIVLDPVRIERTETLVSTTSDTVREVVGDPVETIGLITHYQGIHIVPGEYMLIPIGERTGPSSGDLGLCETSGTTTTPPTGCSNDESQVVAPVGLTWYQFNTNTHYEIEETVTTTELWHIFEHWDVVGVVRAVGVVHTAVQSGAFDSTSRFLRRMGDESAVAGVVTVAAGPLGYATVSRAADDATRAFGAFDGEQAAAPGYHVWLEGYGTRANTSDQGAVPGDSRTAWGIAGGVNFAVSPNFTLGLGIDHGGTNVRLDGPGESASIDLTQLGLSASWREGAWFAHGALTYGFGDASTTQTLGGVSTADYDLRTWGALIETGYRFDVGALRVTPSVGFDYNHYRASGFTGVGGAALTADAYSADRTRAWLGLNVGHTWETGTGRFDLSGYGRVIGVLSGEDRVLPVAFASMPGTMLTATGVAEERIGFDAGLRATYDFGNGASLFAGYDGRFRNGFESHSGTIGLKITW